MNIKKIGPLLKKIIVNFDYYFSVVSMFFVAIVSFGTVISRKVIGKTSASLEEINMIVFIWFLYATIVYSTRKDKHIRIAFLDVYLSNKNQLRIKVLADSIWLVFSIYLTYASLTLVAFNVQYVARTPMYDIPMYIVYSIILISFITMSMFIAINLKERIKNLMGDIDENDNQSLELLKDLT